jgi:tetratricopeptide (TPR) repeat protein
VRVLLLVTVLLLAACQQQPVHPPVTSDVSPVAQLRADGDALMARGEYALAVEKFRQAVDLEPGNVSLRFALGIAYSFLDRRPEAIAQLRWVMANAAAEMVEYQEARRWLQRVGALIEAPAVAPKPEAAAEAKKVDPSLQGSVAGTTQWPGVNPSEHRIPIKVSIAGSEESTQKVGMRRDITLGQGFEFKDVPEGQYRLVGIYDDRAIWDQNITVKAGKQTDVTLTQADSSVTVDTFPRPARDR